MTHKKFITQESENWVKEGIIDADQQARILEKYPQSAFGNPLMIFFSIIGFLLIGTGVILIFAFNWWRLPLPVRLILAFIPLLVAQGFCVFTAVKKSASIPFREGCATLLSLTFFATVALIDQAFHIQNDLQTYLFLCGLCTLPAVYFFNSKAALTIAAACAFFAPAYGILPLLTVPLFYLSLKKENRRELHSYLLILFAAIFIRIAIKHMPNLEEMWFPVVGMMLLLIDAVYRKISPDYFNTPIKIIGCMTIGISLCVFCWVINSGYYFRDSNQFEFLASALLIFFAYAGLRRIRWCGPVIGDALMVSVLALALVVPVIPIIVNFLLLALGVLLIVWGSKQYRIGYLNIGMFFLIVLIAIWFFDSSMSLLFRGIVFVLLGAGFLAVNIIIARKKGVKS